MIKIGLLILLVLLLPSLPANAHVEKGLLPDSVAEMEYRILLEFKPDDIATRSLLGMALLRQNKLSEAEKEFRLLLKSEPKNFDALDSLGLILYKQKHFPEALQNLQTAITLRPDDTMVHLHLGMALASNGQADYARTTLVTGVKLLSSHPHSPSKEQQMAEFQSAIATLSKKSDAMAKK
ncbi:MAG: tetratricopeptide repeat protein [Desulfobulbaceae bacterium]|nr:tetratricopeptide repeat protein [Desulfobulbaceae bacterium]